MWVRQSPRRTTRGALAALDRLLRGPAPVTTITGAAGIGKTALALQAAHLARPHFPDGQLYADFRAGDADPALVVAEL